MFASNTPHESDLQSLDSQIQLIDYKLPTISLVVVESLLNSDTAHTLAALTYIEKECEALLLSQTGAPVRFNVHSSDAQSEARENLLRLRAFIVEEQRGGKLFIDYKELLYLNSILENIPVTTAVEPKLNTTREILQRAIESEKYIFSEYLHLDIVSTYIPCDLNHETYFAVARNFLMQQGEGSIDKSPTSFQLPSNATEAEISEIAESLLLLINNTPPNSASSERAFIWLFQQLQAFDPIPDFFGVYAFNILTENVDRPQHSTMLDEDTPAFIYEQTYSNKLSRAVIPIICQTILASEHVSRYFNQFYLHQVKPDPTLSSFIAQESLKNQQVGLLLIVEAIGFCRGTKVLDSSRAMLINSLVEAFSPVTNLFTQSTPEAQFNALIENNFSSFEKSFYVLLEDSYAGRSTEAKELLMIVSKLALSSSKHDDFINLLNQGLFGNIPILKIFPCYWGINDLKKCFSI
jgi:hypothetical protein